MELFNNDFCKIEFFPNFAILTIEKDTVFTLDKATIVRNQFLSFFKNKKFVIIAHRKNDYETEKEVYQNGQLSNMKGLAIVSKSKNDRDKAILEQKFFDKSFAFFEVLEDAKSWAESYF